MVAAHTVLALLADHVDPEPLLDRAAEEASNTVRLPIGRGDDLVDCGAVLAAEQGEDLILLAGWFGRRGAALRLLAALPRTMRGPLGLVGFLAMVGLLVDRPERDCPALPTRARSGRAVAATHACWRTTVQRLHHRGDHQG